MFYIWFHKSFLINQPLIIIIIVSCAGTSLHSWWQLTLFLWEQKTMENRCPYCFSWCPVERGVITERYSRNFYPAYQMSPLFNTQQLIRRNQFRRYCLICCLTLRLRHAFSIGHKLYGERFVNLMIQKVTECLLMMYIRMERTPFFIPFLTIGWRGWSPTGLHTWWRDVQIPE